MFEHSYFDASIVCTFLKSRKFYNWSMKMVFIPYINLYYVQMNLCELFLSYLQ